MTSWPGRLTLWVQIVTLGLWLGGLIAVGALVAPTAFHTPGMTRDLAGAVVGGSLRKFNGLCDVCGVLLLLSLLVRPRRPFTALSVILTALLLVSALYLGQGLFRQMDAAQGQGKRLLFYALHHRYERISGLQFPLLLALAFTLSCRAGAPADTPPANARS